MTEQPKYKSIDMTCLMGAPENPSFENAQGWTVRLEYGPWHNVDISPRGLHTSESAAPKDASSWRYNMEIPFYMGSAHGMTPPSLEMVLDCIFRDDPDGDSLDDWAADYCDVKMTLTEWKREQETYATIRRNAASLRTLLGDDFEAIRAEIEGLEL